MNIEYPRIRLELTNIRRLKDEVLLLDIFLAAKKAIKFCNSQSVSELETNEMETSAILFNILIIDERFKKISTDYQSEYSAIPWNKIGGFYGRIVRGLRDTQYPELWSVVKNDLPELIELLGEIIPQKPKVDAIIV